MVQSGDACTFRPIQAVTSKDGEFSIHKEASEIDVGDIVFCQVGTPFHQRFYAHIVHNIEWGQKYWIRNIPGRINGWCFKEHIFGILVDVQVLQDGHWHSRPLPKTAFAEVQELIENNHWNRAAATLCKPRREAHSSGSRSDS